MRGTTVGPYEIEELLGSGGMGNVYAARLTKPGSAVGVGERVAVKFVHPHLLETPGFFKRFLREAEIGRSVQHENVVRTLDADAFVVDGRHLHFLVMELVEGQTLADLVGELGQVPEELCRHIGREVARGLSQIHTAGIVHRDMKPENVLITPDHHVKIMDLGVARLMDEAVRLSQSGLFVGSLLYAAPEQLGKSTADLDGRVDLYSLGLVLYELSTGVQPFASGTQGVAQVLPRILNEKPRRVSDLNPQVSPFFEEVVHTLIEKDRERRFPSARVLGDILSLGEESPWWRERRVLLRQTTQRPLRRIRIPRDTALFGRDDDLAVLRKAYDTARAGTGRVVILSGEAGIGKTRLVDEFIARLQAENEELNFLFGVNPPGGAATASAAFADAYRQHLGEDAIEDQLGEYLRDTQLLVPSFAALLRGESVPVGGVALDKDSLQTVFVQTARRLAEERPTVILIDDLHYAPEDGLALFAALSLAVRDHRVLLVGTTRPGLDEDWLASIVRMEHASQRQLERLGAKDLADLLADAFGSRRLADELGMLIARRSDGNPFFVFEMLRGLREQGLIAQRADGAWASTARIMEVQVPSSLRELVQARVARLDEDSRDLLDVAACYGFEFDPLVIGEVLGLRRIPLLKQLARIERTHRLVRSVGVKYVFDHHQAREALYGGLSELLRREYHAAIAEVLGADTEAVGEQAVVLAHHLVRAGDGDGAGPHVVAALDHLDATHAFAAAVSFVEEALACTGALTGAARVEALIRKAGWESLLGRSADERATLRLATEGADVLGDDGVRAKARNYQGRAERIAGEYDTAEALLVDALALAERAGDRVELARGEGVLGNVDYSRGRYADALTHYERQLELNREAGDRHGEAAALGNAALALAELGRRDEARARHEARLALSKELGDRAGQAQSSSNLALLLESLGDLDGAEALYLRALELARELGARRSESIALGGLANVLAMRGRVEESRRMLQDRVRIDAEIGYRRGQARGTLNLGIASADLGRWADALRQYESALALAQEIGDRQAVAIVLVNLAVLRVALGDHTGASAAIDECRARCAEMGARYIEAYTWAADAARALAEDDHAAAAEFVERAIAMHTELGNRGGVAEALPVLATAHTRRGEEAAASTALERAAELAAELGLPGPEAVALCERAALPGGVPGVARERLRELDGRLRVADRMRVRFALYRASGEVADLIRANETLLELVEHAPVPARQTMVRDVAEHRAIAEAFEARFGDGDAPVEDETRIA